MKIRGYVISSNRMSIYSLDSSGCLGRSVTTGISVFIAYFISFIIRTVLVHLGSV
jgi:hypothetical protein